MKKSLTETQMKDTNGGFIVLASLLIAGAFGYAVYVEAGGTEPGEGSGPCPHGWNGSSCAPAPSESSSSGS